MSAFYKLTVNSPAASYIPLPRFLLQDKAFQDLSNDSKVLYAMLLDRASISKQNGYLEPDGTIRLYFTLEDAQKKLHRSRQCATRIFPGAGIQRPDQPQKARFGQTGCHYAELLSGRC